MYGVPKPHSTLPCQCGGRWGADRGSLTAQILVVGKLIQPGILSWAAYRTETAFRERTGIKHSAFISEPRTGTQVRAMPWHLEHISRTAKFVVADASVAATPCGPYAARISSVSWGCEAETRSICQWFEIYETPCFCKLTHCIWIAINASHTPCLLGDLDALRFSV